MKNIAIALIFMIFGTAHAMGDNYQKNANGGYTYTGGAHLKGCSNQFQVGVSTRAFIHACMKIDGINVKRVERTSQLITQSAVYHSDTFGADTFHFKNNVLDMISRN